MMERFEYMQITTVPTGGTGAAAVHSIDGKPLEGQWPDFAAELVRWGSDGWELVTTLAYPGGTHQWIFKRRVPLMRSDALVA